jgi:Mor family transcriptional regulator
MRTIKERANKIQSGDVYKQFEELLGAGLAIKVMNHFAGQTLYFPRGFSLANKYQNIIQEWYEGATYDELAQKYDYTS